MEVGGLSQKAYLIRALIMLAAFLAAFATFYVLGCGPLRSFLMSIGIVLFVLVLIVFSFVVQKVDIYLHNKERSPSFEAKNVISPPFSHKLMSVFGIFLSVLFLFTALIWLIFVPVEAVSGGAVMLLLKLGFCALSAFYVMASFGWLGNCWFSKKAWGDDVFVFKYLFGLRVLRWGDVESAGMNFASDAILIFPKGGSRIKIFTNEYGSPGLYYKLRMELGDRFKRKSPELEIMLGLE